jgi:hypothetical protein
LNFRFYPNFIRSLATSLDGYNHKSAQASARRHQRKRNGSNGILTVCPSPTPFGLGLGPTNPGTINVAQETLGLRCLDFSSRLWLLMPTFSLHATPPSLTGQLHCRHERSSTTSRKARNFELRSTNYDSVSNFKLINLSLIHNS